MFSIDTNLFVYAHNIDSEFHEKSVTFIERAMNEQDVFGNLLVHVPAQVFIEFIHVITWQRLQNPLSLEQARQIVQDYIDAGINILPQQSVQLQTFLGLLEQVTTRKKIFDVALIATLKDNGIVTFYTANVKDFEEFEFLTVINPLIS